jgi:hypothetical protein
MESIIQLNQEYVFLSMKRRVKKSYVDCEIFCQFLDQYLQQRTRFYGLAKVAEEFIAEYEMQGRVATMAGDYVETLMMPMELDIARK